MKQNYIITNGIEKADLESALENLVSEYSGYEKYGSLKLLEIDSSNNVYAIIFENEPDFEKFSYVVNFIKYPIGPEYKNANVIGYYTLNEDLPLPNISTERLMIYIPNDDRGHFNVSVQTESNKSFMFNWDEKVMFKEIDTEITFNEPNIDITNIQTSRKYDFQKIDIPKSGCMGGLLILVIGVVALIKNML